MKPVDARSTAVGAARNCAAGQQSLLETLLPPPRCSLVPPEPAEDRSRPGSLAAHCRPTASGSRSASARASIWCGRPSSIRDVGLIGCEPYINGVAKCLAHIERDGRRQRAAVHRRCAAGDGGAAAASLSRAFVLFPDPWPKTRHHKRRFVQRETLDVLARLDEARRRAAAGDRRSELPAVDGRARLHAIRRSNGWPNARPTGATGRRTGRRHATSEEDAGTPSSCVGVVR